MRLRDGTTVFYRAWLPTAPTDKAMLLFHRGHEHSGRLADVVATLRESLPDVAMFAWDARGHGRSEGDRGWAPSFGCMVQDLDTFVRHIGDHYGFAIENTVILAHSVGAVTASTWVHDYAPRIRGLVLATPAFRVKLYVPFALPGLRLMQWWKGGAKSFVKSYVKARMLTHDAEQARRYDQDPLIARAIAVNILLGMDHAARRVVADSGAIRVPTLMLSGGADWVVRVSTQRRFFAGLRSPQKKSKLFPGMYHDILHETDRAAVLQEIVAFVADRFAQPPQREPLLDAHRHGYTKDEYDALSRPLAPLSPRRIFWGCQALVLRTVGRLSRGVSLGWESGFDSGRTLDYVYANQSHGRLGIGKWIDRTYLDSPGWRGIRVRRIHLQQLLATAIRSVAATERPVRILDIATGAGRYVLETIRDLRAEAGGRALDIAATLRDLTPANLETGRELAAELGVDGVKYEQGDAFDEGAIASVDPAPNIGIVSGLYELFPDNDSVLASLRGMRRALAAGAGDGPAYLVYTGQPWHPQLEMIARVLINRDGKRWVMRRRTQEEMDDLVQSVGFRKIAMEIDEHGIFTVSLARLDPNAGA